MLGGGGGCDKSQAAVSCEPPCTGLRVAHALVPPPLPPAGKVAYTLDRQVTLLSTRGVRGVESPEPINVADCEGGKVVTLSETGG